MTAQAFDLADGVVGRSATTSAAAAPAGGEPAVTTAAGTAAALVTATSAVRIPAPAAALARVALPAAQGAAAMPQVASVFMPMAYADPGPVSPFGELLAAAVPGPELAWLLADAGSRPLSEADRLAVAAGWQRMAGWVEAGLASAVVAIVGEAPAIHTVVVDDRTLALGDLARHELGIVLRETPTEVRNRIHQARTLVHELPRVHAALRAGAITSRHARVLRDATDRMALGRNLDDPTTAHDHQARIDALCDRLLPATTTIDDRTLARRARALVLRLDADGAARRAAAARRHHTDVWVQHGDDGLATLTARMPSETAHACLHTIHTIANTNHTLDPDTPIGYQRATALADLVTGRAAIASTSSSTAACMECTACGSIDTRAAFTAVATSENEGAVDDVPWPPRPPRPTPHVQVHLVMTLDSFLRLDEQPAELLGLGPIPADTARALIAADPSATIRRLLTDPMTGHLLDAGRHRYTVDDRLREYLNLRDQRCRFPGCTRQADTCDLDHATNFDGTNTTAANLGALCRAHHLAKTHGGWRITASDPTGACTWQAPTGTTYQHPAQTLLTDASATDTSNDTTTPASNTADDDEPCPSCDTRHEVRTRLPYLHGHTTRHDPRISRIEAHAHHLGICAY